jgi:hypothetical protein
VRSFLAVMASAVMLSGCMQVIGGIAATSARDKFQKCVADYKATPEAQMLAHRIWQGDGADTAEKLSDPKPLTPAERDALVKLHPQAVQCRQIIIAHDNTFAAWEAPHWQAYFARTDQIFTRLASGEMPVGVANKLAIESNGQFQTETSRGQADEVRFQQVQNQRAAEAMMQANAAIAANQPRMTTTNCMWSGNMINCTGMR